MTEARGPQLPKPGPRAYLRRYTYLPAVLHMLRKRSLTLLDPNGWDDRNDSFYMSEYKRRKGLRTLLAVCLTGAEETHHHWKVFAGHESGVCVRIRQGMLLKLLRTASGIKVGKMAYHKIKGVRQWPLEDYPFVKRAALADENEVRVLFESATKLFSSLEVSISLDCISRVTLSPWLPKDLFRATKAAIQGIDGCSHVEVVRSTIINSERWKNIVRNAE